MSRKQSLSASADITGGPVSLEIGKPHRSEPLFGQYRCIYGEEPPLIEANLNKAFDQGYRLHTALGDPEHPMLFILERLTKTE